MIVVIWDWVRHPDPTQHVNAQVGTGNPHFAIPPGQNSLVLGIQKEIAVVPPICMGMGLISVKQGGPILIFLSSVPLNQKCCNICVILLFYLAITSNLPP